MTRTRLHSIRLLYERLQERQGQAAFGSMAERHEVLRALSELLAALDEKDADIERLKHTLALGLWMGD
jgi:hypothetical protein